LIIKHLGLKNCSQIDHATQVACKQRQRPQWNPRRISSGPKRSLQMRAAMLHHANSLLEFGLEAS
jgi:hypothetical protein